MYDEVIIMCKMWPLLVQVSLFTNREDMDTAKVYVQYILTIYNLCSPGVSIIFLNQYHMISS